MEMMEASIRRRAMLLHAIAHSDQNMVSVA